MGSEFASTRTTAFADCPGRLADRSECPRAILKSDGQNVLLTTEMGQTHPPGLPNNHALRLDLRHTHGPRPELLVVDHQVPSVPRCPETANEMLQAFRSGLHGTIGIEYRRKIRK